MTYGVGNPDPGLGQTQKCGRVKPGNCLQVIIGDYFFKKQVLDIYNINVVSIHFKFMCMRLKNWYKGDVHRTISQYCTEYTYNLCFKTLYQYCVYSAEKLY